MERSSSPALTAPFDLYGVTARREGLLARAASPRFRAWWPAFLGACRSAPAPTLPEGVPDAARHGAVTALLGQAEELAFAARVTADGALARQAADGLMTALADPAPWMSPGHHDHYPELNADLILAERCKRVAATLSWAGAWLTPAEHRAVRAALRDRGGAVIHADAERGAWWADGYNSNWTAVLNSGLGLAALAVAPEYPLEAERWLERAIAAARAMLDLAAAEGAGVEGAGYWIYCFSSLMDLAAALAAAGDRQLIEHPCWRKAVEFPLYQALPDFSGWLNFGDCGYPGLSGSPLFYALASRLGDRRAQWLAHRISGEPPQARVTWRDLLWCDPDLPGQGPEALPPARLFHSVHLAMLRSDWSAEAVQFALKGGSNAWSHCHLDLNSFVLNAGGERLAVDPGPWPYTEHYWTSIEPPLSTAWHNTLTVDGADQRQPPRFRLSYDLEESGDAWCRLGGFHDDGTVATVWGDAAAAYGDVLERFVRRVHYRRPGLFVVVDEIGLRPARVQRHLQWLLHAVLPMEPTPAGGVRIRGLRRDLWVTPVLPLGFRAKVLPDRCGPPGSARPPVHAWALRPPWHHLWNVSPSRSPYPQWDPRGTPGLYGTDHSFVVVLEVTPAGHSPTWSPRLSPDEESLVLTAAGAAGGEWTVPLAAPDTTPA